VNYRLSWFLRHHAGESHSLDDIATAIGRTPAQVSRDLEELRGTGFQVDAHPATGLLVAAVPQAYDRDELNLVGAGRRIGHTVHVYDSTGSTNDVAMGLAGAGRQTDGLVVVAEEQTAGRGRQGAEWVGTRSESLLVSVIHWMKPCAERAAETVLAAGVAVADAIAEVTGLRVGIKWPNDVEVDRRKVAGILVECAGPHDDGGSGQEVCGVPYVIGIGVNVNQSEEDFPAAISGQAASLRMAAGRVVDRILLLDRILRRLDEGVTQLDAGALEGLLDRYMRHCDMIGRAVAVREGPETFCGTVEAISPHYALVVRLESGELRSFGVSGVRVRGRPEGRR